MGGSAASFHIQAVFGHDLIGNDSNSSFFLKKKKKLFSQPCAQTL